MSVMADTLHHSIDGSFACCSAVALAYSSIALSGSMQSIIARRLLFGASHMFTRKTLEHRSD